MDAERAARLSSVQNRSYPKQSYINICLEFDQINEWKLSPQERYQKILRWRFHRPTIMERRNLKIPQAILKLDLKDLSHLLILCGGNRQMEFSIQEINEIETIIENLNNEEQVLQEIFQKLSRDSSTFQMPGHHVKHFLKLREGTSKNDSFLGTLFGSSKVSSEKDIEINHSSVCTDPDHCTCPSTPMTSSEPEKEFHSTPHPQEHHELSILDSILDTFHLKPPDNPSEIEEEVMGFHQHADTVQKILRKIQKFILCKYRQPPVRKQYHDPLENVDDLREDWWLEVLIKKYRSEYLTPAENGRVEEEEKSQSQPQRNGNVDAVESKGRPYLPPIAHFSVFLSCCLLEDIDCSPTEQKALYKLLHVSQDFRSQNDLKLLLEGNKDYIFQHTQDYWVSRIFLALAEITSFDMPHSSNYSNTEMLKEIRKRYYGDGGKSKSPSTPSSPFSSFFS